MPKKSLKEQIQSIEYRDADTEDFDDIIDTTPEKVTSSAKNKITMLPLEKLVEYKDENFEKIAGRPQPFREYSQEDLESLADSILKHGIITPIVVRPFGIDQYQILAGRNRTRASKICGLTEIPGIVRKDIDDVQAALIMIDTNIEQRQSLTYSEKAYAYRMRLELIGQQGKRNDLSGSEKTDSLAEVGKEHKESRRTVAYLIRLTHLLPEFLKLVDDGKIAFKVGVEMSYLAQETQEYILNTIIPSGGKIKAGQISDLRKIEKYETLSEEIIQRVFQRQNSISPSLTISGTKFQEYADLFKNKEEIERLFLEFLKAYRYQQRSA